MSNSTQPTAEQERAAYVAGLRSLADVLENRPEVPLPYEGRNSEITFFFLSGADPKAEMAACARALPTNWTKETSEYGKQSYFKLHGSLGGLKVMLHAFRDQVCERIVVGTREETIEEPDPDLLAAATANVPLVKRTEVVETVEWRCTPLLAAAPVEQMAEV